MTHITLKHRAEIALYPGAWIDRIKINHLTRREHNGRTVLSKRRRFGSRVLIVSANAFFRTIGHPISVLATGPEWQQWEVESFALLHGGAFLARPEGRNGVEVELLPGRTLCSLLDEGRLTAAMMRSAGLELRRAHEQRMPYFEGPWSHGDPHLGNFVFDPSTARSRMIDFEVRHHRKLTVEERHLEDLLVPLLDLMGRCPQTVWVPFCQSFLAAYDRPDLMSRLCARLVAPRGPARAWWAIRTGYLNRSAVQLRLGALCAALEGIT